MDNRLKDGSPLGVASGVDWVERVVGTGRHLLFFKKMEPKNVNHNHVYSTLQSVTATYSFVGVITLTF